jgi:hypothetical protein
MQRLSFAPTFSGMFTRCYLQTVRLKLTQCSSWKLLIFTSWCFLMLVLPQILFLINHLEPGGYPLGIMWKNSWARHFRKQNAHTCKQFIFWNTLWVLPLCKHVVQILYKSGWRFFQIWNLVFSRCIFIESGFVVGRKLWISVGNIWLKMLKLLAAPALSSWLMMPGIS